MGFPVAGNLLPNFEAVMVPNANARHFLLKAKQRDLIAAAGGIERAATICSSSKSVVGRWASPDAPDLMTIGAIFSLEEETGRFDMSEAIAASRGRRFDEVEASPSASISIMTRHAEAAVLVGELMSTGAMAFADGKITPSEAQQLDRKISALEEALAIYRKDVAGARGAGGLSLVGEVG